MRMILLLIILLVIPFVSANVSTSYSEGRALVNNREFLFVIDNGQVEIPLAGVDGDFYSYEVFGINVTQEFIMESGSLKVLHKIHNKGVIVINKAQFSYLIGLNQGETYDFDSENQVTINEELTYDYQDIIDMDFVFTGYTEETGYLRLDFEGRKIEVGEEIIIDPEFSTNDIESIRMDTAGNNSYGIITCDETLNDIISHIHYANGSLQKTTTLDDNVLLCREDNDNADMAFTNWSAYAFCHLDYSAGGNGNDVICGAADIWGDIFLTPFKVDDFVSTGTGYVRVVANQTHFWPIYYDSLDDKYYWAVYGFDGSTLLSPTEVDSATGAGGNIGWRLNNHTHATASISLSGDAYYFMLDSSGNVFKKQLVSGLAAGNTDLLLFDDDTGMISFQVIGLSGNTYYDIYTLSTGTSLKGVTISMSNTDNSQCLSSSAINSTAGVQLAEEQPLSDFSYVQIDNAGTIFVSKTDIDTSATAICGSAGKKIVNTETNFCEDAYAYAFVEAANNASSWVVYPNQTLWDGSCGLTPTPADSCDSDYILCSDHCVLTSEKNGGGGTLTITGTGTFNGAGFVTNYDLIQVSGGCNAKNL